MENYESKRFIGAGGFGQAFTVRSKLDKKIYVLKTISAVKLTQSDKSRGQKEIDALKKLSHNNVVQYISDFYEDKQIHIIMEYCENGDLATIIENQRDNFEENKGKEYF